MSSGNRPGVSRCGTQVIWRRRSDQSEGPRAILPPMLTWPRDEVRSVLATPPPAKRRYGPLRYIGFGPGYGSNNDVELSGDITGSE
jgi:hypothetical protein